MKQLVLIPAVFLALSPPASADVTIMSTLSGKGMGMSNVGAQSVTYIKGTKMRSETGDMISIIDANSRQMIVLNTKKREAEIYDMAKLQAEMESNLGVEPQVQMTPNGQTREILGKSCAGYNMAISLPMTMGNDQVTLTLAGPVWIAKGAPGASDYAAFYKIAADKGLFFANPQQVRAQGAQVKSMSAMYRALAETGGVPYATEMQFKFEGTGMIAAMMTKMGGMTMSTMVTGVSADSIPEDKFAVPAGYATKQK